MTRRRKPPTATLPLTTARLVLREFRETDLDDIHAYGADPEVTRFMLWGPNTPQDSRAFLERTLEAQTVAPRLNTAVELIETRKVIGAIELRVLNAELGVGELGYAFNRSCWGQGLAVEASQALLEQGFERLWLRRVVATCDVRNRGSWRVMEKLGMRREGCFRKDVKTPRGWRDSYLYAILASEWRARTH